MLYSKLVATENKSTNKLDDGNFRSLSISIFVLFDGKKIP